VQLEEYLSLLKKLLVKMDPVGPINKKQKHKSPPAAAHGQQDAAAFTYPAEVDHKETRRAHERHQEPLSPLELVRAFASELQELYDAHTTGVSTRRTLGGGTTTTFSPLEYNQQRRDFFINGVVVGWSFHNHNGRFNHIPIADLPKNPACENQVRKAFLQGRYLLINMDDVESKSLVELLVQLLKQQQQEVGDSEEASPSSSSSSSSSAAAAAAPIQVVFFLLLDSF